jgi:hypothetical protein
MEPDENEQGFSEQTGNVSSGDTGYADQTADTEYAGTQDLGAEGIGECAVCYYEGQTYSVGSERCGNGGYTKYRCEIKDGSPQWIVAVGANYPICTPSGGGSSDSNASGEEVSDMPQYAESQY